MKKLLLISLVTLMILLNACGQSSDEPITDYDSVYGYLEYDWYTMSYTDTPYLITNNSSTLIDDFIILHDLTLSEEELSLSAITAYTNVFVMLEALHNSSNMNYSLLLNYSSSEIKDKCDKYSIDLTITDIVSFNSLTQLIDEIKASQYSSSILILDYIEYRLDVELSNEEIESLALLQYFYYDLMRQTQDFEIKDTLLEDFLLEILNVNGIELEAEDLIKIDDAYDLILALHN